MASTTQSRYMSKLSLCCEKGVIEDFYCHRDDMQYLSSQLSLFISVELQRSTHGYSA